MSKFWVLDGKTPIQADMKAYARWMGSAAHSRHVALTRIGNANTSTVFLGIDHNHSGEGPPILFETMVFGGLLDQEMERYSTWEEAETGHKAMVERVRAAQ